MLHGAGAACSDCGSSCGFMVGASSGFPDIDGGRSKGYIVIAPKDSGSGANVTFTIGPVTEHFTNQAVNGGDSLNYGMASSFTAVPSGMYRTTRICLQ